MSGDAVCNGSTLESNGLTWKQFKQFQHRYLVNVPDYSEEAFSYPDAPKYFHLPYPIFNPVDLQDFDACRNLFRGKEKLDSRMEYYRKLFRKDKILKKDLKSKKIIQLPQYIIDIIKNTERRDDCNVWNYTGGLLDTFHLNGTDYIVNSGFCQIPEVKDLGDCSITLNLNVDEGFPIYCIKASTEQDYALISMRHKYKTSVIQIRSDTDILQQNLVCRTTTADFYEDMSINAMQNKEYATVTNTYKLRVIDLEKSHVRDKYTFEMDDHAALTDSLARIEFIDKNTICFMNRCCVHLLDLRSLQTQKLCFNKSWIECDDLCCISKNKKYTNYLYVTSRHRLTKLDIRLLKQNNQIMHMLSTAPFIASIQENGFEENICLCGPQNNDRVILRDNGTLSTPLYIPNPTDTLTKACLSQKFTFHEEFEQRLGCPVIGMKLHKDVNTDNINLYTSTTVGDIFKQKLTNSKSDDVSAAEILIEWLKMILQSPPKTLEATSICNLNKMMHVITNNFPNERNLKHLMGNDVSQRFKKRFSDVSRYLQNSVGEAINAIWDEPAIDAPDAQPSSTENKVSDWLSSVS